MTQQRLMIPMLSLTAVWSNTPASLFCKECDCNLCDNCISDHNDFKLTRNHEMELLKLTE